METDPASLDPEERMNKWYAMFSVAFGVISLCAVIIPICGGPLAILGIIFGVLGMRADNPALAKAGIGLSSMGLLILVVYVLILFSGVVLDF